VYGNTQAIRGPRPRRLPSPASRRTRAGSQPSGFAQTLVIRIVRLYSRQSWLTPSGGGTTHAPPRAHLVQPNASIRPITAPLQVDDGTISISPMSGILPWSRTVLPCPADSDNRSRSFWGSSPRLAPHRDPHEKWTHNEHRRSLRDATSAGPLDGSFSRESDHTGGASRSCWSSGAQARHLGLRPPHRRETGSARSCSERRFAVAPARRLEVAPLRVGWCVWVIFSD